MIGWGNRRGTYGTYSLRYARNASQINPTQADDAPRQVASSRRSGPYAALAAIPRRAANGENAYAARRFRSDISERVLAQVVPRVEGTI